MSTYNKNTNSFNISPKGEAKPLNIPVVANPILPVCFKHPKYLVKRKPTADCNCANIKEQTEREWEIKLLQRENELLKKHNAEILRLKRRK